MPINRNPGIGDGGEADQREARGAAPIKSGASRIGPFEVLDQLGAGGMGEVWKARDTRLNRFVALKFLPELASAAARERFTREAQAVAALNHPHICTLHEVGDDHGRPFLVLELLEGETLKARLRRGPLEPDQLLDCAIQIADALAAAHAKGILHRDLKPDNIWVSSGGHIKVLDFGLARIEQDAAADQATVLTSPGQTMGTIPYMSPEQARGEPLDPRSDIFSFGSVFYEMAAGRPAFPAANAADSIAAVLRGEPAKLSSLRPGTSPFVEQVAERCLEKDPDLRYQSAADLRGELKRLKRESGSASAATAVAAPDPLVRASGHSRLAAFAALAALAALAAVAAVAWFFLRPHAAPAQLAFRQLTFTGQVQDAAMSPDGKFLAHVDIGPQGTSLHLMAVANASDTQIVPPGAGCCQSPTFSPDGNTVYFDEANLLKSVPVLGGEVRTIAGSVCSGAGFSPDGQSIAFIAPTLVSSVLMLARADGSQARMLSDPKPGGYDSACWDHDPLFPDAPAWSPDGRWIAVDEHFPGGKLDHLQLVQADGGGTRPLGPPLGASTSDLAWLPDGSGLVVALAHPSTSTPQLWEVTYPDGNLVQLTHDLQGYDRASVAPQAAGGAAIALVHSAPESSVWRQAAVGGPFEQLPGGGPNQDGRSGLAWTPSGEIVSLRRLGTTPQIWIEGGAQPPRMLPLDHLPAVIASPAVAPDGTIVFQGYNGSAGDWHLYRAARDGGALTDLTPGQIATQAAILAGGRVGFRGVDQVWSVPLAGGAPHSLWPAPVGNRLFLGLPDQAHLLVLAHPSRLQFIPAVGGPPSPVKLQSFDTWRGDIAGPPFGITPDGRSLVATISHGSVDNLWAFPLDAGPPYPLTHFTDLSILSLAFSRDGRLAVSRGKPNRDAVLATGLGGSR